jgi:NAD(P)H-dependent flavin oxidoreductase YrpB (nitropropane dioxygenase family)
MLEAEKRGFPLLRTISGLSQMRRVFHVPWWKLLLSALRMKQAYEIPASGLGELAYASFGGERMNSGLVHGDRDFGFMPCGQVCGRIDDIPTCKELIERIVYGAEEILDSIGVKIRS